VTIALHPGNANVDIEIVALTVAGTITSPREPEREASCASA
jgi:hypothetical protein